jgi:hypothetical protein
VSEKTVNRVHMSHCCPTHGCKYGPQTECPVYFMGAAGDELCGTLQICQDQDEMFERDQGLYEATAPLLLWEILVPTTRRIGGRPYSLRYHRVWDAKVRAIAGGLTILHPTKGQWVSPDGQLFIERMIPVRIACTRAQIDAIAEMTGTYYDQLAVMYSLIASEVVIKDTSPETRPKRKCGRGKR